ncbi:MAG TPA: hypothetical protein VFA05_11205 [Gaiellaceae bacterium]|nr:hypothetical protein [Gaiellaceae bacterium]
MSRRLLRWGLPQAPPPAHPYRDSLIVFAALAALIVLVGWATGGDVGRAAIVAGVFFVAAFLYNVVRWRTRLHAARNDAEDGL